MRLRSVEKRFYQVPRDRVIYLGSVQPPCIGRRWVPKSCSMEKSSCSISGEKSPCCTSTNTLSLQQYVFFSDLPKTRE
jgi:hypothetical protein